MARRLAADPKVEYELDTRSSIVDTLADLMHLCEQRGIPFENCMSTARGHYEAEKAGLDDE